MELGGGGGINIFDLYGSDHLAHIFVQFSNYLNFSVEVALCVSMVKIARICELTIQQRVKLPYTSSQKHRAAYCDPWVLKSVFNICLAVNRWTVP